MSTTRSFQSIHRNVSKSICYQLSVKKPFSTTTISQIKSSKNKKVHQTKTKESILLDSSYTSNFKLLSSNSLKSECKKRGLPQYGKKSELINRLTSFESSQQSREISSSSVKGAKNDSSSIDSYKLPSQASINEWEYKYDYSRVPSTKTKIPSITPDAIKYDKIQHEKQKAELTKNHQNSVKVEANDAKVVLAGSEVKPEPEYLHDKYSSPVDQVSSEPILPKKTKIKNSENYVQSSLNPKTNHTEIVNLGGRVINDVISKEVSSTATPIVEDPHTEVIPPKETLLSQIKQTEFYKKFNENSEALGKDEKFTYQEGQISTREQGIFAGVLIASGIWWLLAPNDDSN